MIASSADVDASASVGDGSSVWHLAQIRERASIGVECSIGRGAYIGSGVVIGNRVKVQNYALVYEPAVIEDGVFIGPGVVLTNDVSPRAVNPDGTRRTASDWNPVGVTVHVGASLGARSVCVAPVTIGSWSMVAAGAVVIEDVPAHALVGGVPARRIGWVGRAGRRLLDQEDGTLVCPDTGDRFHQHGGTVTVIEAEPA